MKTRDWGMGLALLAASWLVAGCGMEYKKKYEEADARALQATTRLNDTTTALEKAKADNAKLEATLKQKNDQITALKAENKQVSDAAKADAKRMADEVKASQEKAAGLAKQVEQAKADAAAKAKEAEQANANAQKLEQESKRLQGIIDRLRTQPPAKPEPNTPPGTGAAQR